LSRIGGSAPSLDERADDGQPADAVDKDNRSASKHYLAIFDSTAVEEEQTEAWFGIYRQQC